MKILLVREPCKGDVGKPSMGLHRPYRALLIANMHNLGLTPQAILCRPFRAPEGCALIRPMIRIVLWAYSVRPYNFISVQETTPGVWEALQCDPCVGWDWRE